MNDNTKIKYSYDELAKFCDNQHEEMSGNEKYQRLVHCGPTFEEYVLSAMNPGDIVYIDEENKSYVITNTTK